MIRRKKEIKRIFFAAVFIITMCLSSVQILNNIAVLQDNKINNTFNENLLDGLLETSISNVDENFTGSGVDQDVRVYVNNKSENLLNNEEYFEIQSVPSEDMFLVHGDFNFTFQNNYTTEYILENDDALYAKDFISFDYEASGSSSIIYTNGTRLSGNFASLTDESNSTYINMDATQGLLDITIVADFTGTTYTSGVINGNVQFNRAKILGFLSSLDFRLFADANLTVKVEDYSQSTWIDIISNLHINSSLGLQSIKQRIINENLNFINLSNVCNIRFIFERFDKSQFYARLNEYNIKATYVFDLPITDQSYVALEFDLKGEESAVNGFYAWIRTLDLTEAATTSLNISLYRSNITVVRTDSNLRNVKLGPDYTDLIDTFIVNGYSEDSLSYFEFNIANTGKLNLSNYFIVIKSNNSLEIYSIVTLPYFDYGDDGKTEHQLKTTLNDGVLWINAKKVIPTTYRPYTSGQLDASSFKLNVTRGYMPSDFIINSNQTLRIQDKPVENLVISSYPYNESSYLKWGIGRWINSFSIAIEDDIMNNFRVDLTWNKANIKGFKFNVSYSGNAYWIENALSSYSVTYNNDPEWLFTYDFNKNNPLFNNWKFFEFWYVFYDYFTAYNVTNPIGDKILPKGVIQSSVDEDPSKNKIIIPSTLAIQSGFYTLILTSYNFIHNMHSYINYKGILWESNGFMNGDNMTISVDIRDHNENAPNGGDMNSTLFYPDGSKFLEINSSSGYIDDSMLIYDFNNQTLLEITNALTIYGKYQLGFFWFNGTAIGCKKITIYIDVYDVVLNDCEYYSTINKNILDGEIMNKVFQNYTMLVASLNETTGISMPNFYAINDTDIDTTFSYSIGGQELELLLTSFQQSENILNPNEKVNIKMTLKNLHPFLPINIRIEVKLVSYINEDWIIAENTSNTVLLYFSGHPNESNEFDLDLTIPDLDEITNIWSGVNAPIRLGGAKTLVNIYIDDPILIGVFESPSYSLLSNQTSDNFEGYILGLKVAEEATSRSILYDFQRDKCIYFPDNSTFLVNIIDQNYISSYKQFTGEYTLNLNSRFTNIITNPNNPIKGGKFNFSSILTTEFGEVLVGKNVSCSYFDGDSLVFIGSDITDSSGFTSFLIDSQTIDFEGNLLLNLQWDGDSVNGVSKNVTVNIIQQSNNLSISIASNEVQIYKGKDATFNIRLINIGNSDLRITNISIEFNHDEAFSIVQINYIMVNWFPAGESTFIIVEVSVEDFNQIRMTVSITAQNIITNESIIVTKEESYITYDPPIFDLILENIMILIIGAIALVFIIAFIIIRKTQKKLEIPIEEIVKKPRRGRYVPVSELKKPTPIKQVPKKKEEPKKISEKEKTDLDSLLEERGLGETKKKPKE